jgi:type IV fimbrial biogenesis protein FimT
MATLLLAGVLLSLGVPWLHDLALDARRTADVNAFVGAIQLARSESAKRAQPVVLCQSADGITCARTGQYYHLGWIVFVDEDGDNPPRRDENEALLLFHAPVIQGSIRSNRAHFLFRAYFRRSINGTVTFCDSRGPQQARAVIVSYTGRPRVTSTTAAGRSLSCSG